MRLLIAGWQGQVARALVEAAPACADVTACAVGRAALDICEARSIERALSGINPTVVINSAAYTAVDKAETDEERAFALNRDGARLLAEAAARRGIPIIHLSTDYVFDGRKYDPYVEDDATKPAHRIRPLQARGRGSGARRQPQARHPAHVVDLQPGRQQLRQDDAGPGRRAFARARRRRSARQPHLRAAPRHRHPRAGAPAFETGCERPVGRLSRRQLRDDDLAAARRGGVPPVARARRPGGCGRPDLQPDYPTPAQRPANSQLDCTKLERTFSMRLPAWQDGVADCVQRIVKG